jgi:hypothetical protein
VRPTADRDVLAASFLSCDPAATVSGQCKRCAALMLTASALASPLIQINERSG